MTDPVVEEYPARARPARKVVLGLGIAVVVALGGTALRDRLDGDDGPATCGAVSVEAGSPLLDAAGMAAQPDARLDRLAAAVGAMPAPFGQVAAGVGYNYDQWLHLYGTPSGILALTKGNAAYTLLADGTLDPRWALEPTRKRTAFDVGEDRFVLLDLDRRAATQVAAFDLGTGARRWCSSSPEKHAAGQPVSTAVLADGDVVTALPDGDRIRVARLDGDDGATTWDRSTGGVARADYVGPLGDDLLLVGGSEQFRLREAARSGSDTPTVTAFDARSGKPAWTWGEGSVSHVVGTTADRVVVQQVAAAGPELVALDLRGSPVWRLPTDAVDTTLRGDVLVTRTATALVALDATTGARVWARPLPVDRTYFPYGFTLGQMPSLDADHLLLPTTASLEVLNLRTGRSQAHPLPTDGVSTTFWPYQLVVTQELLGVVTNTGAVLTSRE